MKASFVGQIVYIISFIYSILGDTCK